MKIIGFLAGIAGVISRETSTVGTGWLSGWAGEGDPPASYSGAGRYPAAAEGVAEMTACFDAGSYSGQLRPCYHHAAVGVVRCDGFLLWRLADAPYCNYGYCTAASFKRLLERG